VSLSTRSRLAGMHPWISSRLIFILEYAEQHGARFSITSVNRTPQRQWELYNQPNSKAVRPGCSQHQYRLASDTLFEEPAWQNWYLQSARNFGLTTVAGDPVHVQAVPGSNFRSLIAFYGLCPDPNYPPRAPITSFAHPDGRVVTNPDGSRTWRWNTQG